MKKLGLIGGMGPESTIPYYHDIVYKVQKKTGSFPIMSIESVDVFHVLDLCAKKEYEKLVSYLSKAIDSLYKSGADFAALSANTPHIVFDKLQERSKIPLLSIIDAACRKTKEENIKKAALLGTKFTMKGDFFKRKFIQNGVDIIIPTDDEMEYINDKISKELELGIVKEDTLKQFLTIIERMKKEDNIQAVILGCTELPLLLNDTNTPVKCLDTVKIHVDAIVNEILSE